MDNTTKDFNETYEKEVLPILEKLESTRQIELQIYYVVKIFFILFAFIPFIQIILSLLPDLIPMGIFRFLFVFSLIFTLPMCPVIAILGYMYTSSKIKKDFSRLVKNRCMMRILPCFENLRWMSCKADTLMIEESGLFSDFTNITRDDIFDGEYNDTEFHIEEVNISNNGSRHSFEIFKGIIIIMPSNKTVETQTIISSKGDANVRNLQPHVFSAIILFTLLLIVITMFAVKFIQESYIEGVIQYIILLMFCVGYLSWLITDTIRKSKRYQKVKLEDINFDKRFAVSSQDQIGARYLVTPAFMERLQNLQTAFGTKDIKCSFFDDKIMFAISSDKDLFEFADLFTPLKDPKQIYQLKQELAAIYDMIDHFKLNERTGL